MMLAIFTEHMRCYRIDRARYHEQMDDFWREKCKERTWNALFPQGRCRGNWGAAGRMAKQKRPAQRQLYKAQRFDLKSIIAWMLW